jgi:hypothetical protein
MERGDDEALAARGGVHEPGPDEGPAKLAATPIAEPDDERLGALAGKGPPPGQLRRVEGSAGFVDDLEAVERRFRRGGEHLLRARPATELGGLLVREDDAELGVLNGDPRVDRLENPAEAIVRCGEAGRFGSRIASSGSTTRWPTFPHATKLDRRDRRECK